MLVNTSGTNQLKFISREIDLTLPIEFNCYIRNHSTNEVDEVAITPSLDSTGDYFTAELTYDFTEGNYYTLIITYLRNSKNEVMSKINLYCTDQTINQDVNENYTINDGEYVEPEQTSNDYIFI